MRTRFALLITLLIAGYSFAQVHIQISDPETWTSQELADYVGQSVIFDIPLVVCSNAASPTLFVSTRRLYTPTNQTYPGTQAYRSLLSLNSSGAVVLTGVSGYHRCGEKIYNLQAKVNNDLSLKCESCADWHGNSRADLEAGLPDLGDYRLLVCGFNLENYFTTIGSMGASNSSQRKRQHEKVKKALKKINADIYGLVELQEGDEALKEITGDLNADQSERLYKFFEKDQSGTYQKVDFVYDANKVKPIGVVQETAAGTIPAKRHKMICFEELATGERFTYSINHFKAKSSPGSGADADQRDGQGGNNARRVAEAQAVMDMYKKYYNNPAIKDKDLLVMGDLNAYGKEDPITSFISNGMIDLHRTFHADSSYSYSYNKYSTSVAQTETAGYIDHALCNATLRPQVTGMAVYHLNSDENKSYKYDGNMGDETMFACSDHDPVLVGLKLDGSLVYDPSPSMNIEEVLSGKTEEMIVRNAFKAGEQAYVAIYSISGLLLKRVEITENAQAVTLPYKPGLYIVYIYSGGQVYQRKIIVR